MEQQELTQMQKDIYHLLVKYYGDPISPFKKSFLYKEFIKNIQVSVYVYAMLMMRGNRLQAAKKIGVSRNYININHGKIAHKSWCRIDMKDAAISPFSIARQLGLL